MIYMVCDTLDNVISDVGMYNNRFSNVSVGF